MNNVRWKSPFPYTLAFNLFKQHFEEINRSYWAFVPAANTVKALAKRNLMLQIRRNSLWFRMKRIAGLHLLMVNGR